MSEAPAPAPAPAAPVVQPSPPELAKAGIQVTPPALEAVPLTPVQRVQALVELARVAEEQRKLAQELESRVADVIPEVGAVLEQIAEQTRENVAKVREAEELIRQDEAAAEAGPLNLNNCFERALSIKRSFEGIPDLLEALQRDEIGVSDAARRTRDTIKTVRQQIARSECLFARAKTFKLRLLDEALREVENENIAAAYQKLREL